VVRLLLARHARTPSNAAALLDTAAPGPDLDDVGLIEAAALAERLAGHSIDAVYVSDLVRAVQTAEPFVRSLGVTHQVMPGLAEVSGGDDEMTAELTRFDTALRSWGEGDPSVRIPGGESGQEFFDRFDGAIAAIADAGHATVLVISHGAAIRAWAGHVMPQVHTLLGTRALPNTAVIVADGDPESGWNLVGIEFPAEEDLQAQPAGPSQGGTQRV
jgi:probable phosphoglycerate mutase